MARSEVPGQWTVEEIKEDGAETWIRIHPSGSYNPDEWWPEVGQTLVVKPKEAKCSE